MPLDAPTNPDRTRGADQRLRARADQHRPRRAQGAERLVHPQQPAEGDRLRLSRRARHRRDREEDRHRLLRAADHVFVLELLLERRPSGSARGAALPGRLRRHRRQRAVGRSDRVHRRRDVEPEGADRGAGLAGQDDAGRAEGDGQVRRGGRPEGRPDRRSARVPLRRGARRAGLQRRRRRRRLPDAGAGGDGEQDLQRPDRARGSRSSPASCRAAKPSTTGAERRVDQRVGRRDRAGAAGREAGGLQPGRRRDALPDPRPAAAGLRLHEVRLRPRHGARRALEQAGRREGRRPVEVPQERRQADHDLRLGRSDSAADDGRELLRGGRRRRTARARPTSRGCS